MPETLLQTYYLFPICFLLFPEMPLLRFITWMNEWMNAQSPSSDTVISSPLWDLFAYMFKYSQLQSHHIITTWDASIKIWETHCNKNILCSGCMLVMGMNGLEDGMWHTLIHDASINSSLNLAFSKHSYIMTQGKMWMLMLHGLCYMGYNEQQNSILFRLGKLDILVHVRLNNDQGIGSYEWWTFKEKV